MARYIEREKFLKKCTEVFGHFGVLVKAIEEISDECTTADVAPKSEVAKEIFQEIDKELYKVMHKYRDYLDANGVIYTNYARAIVAELKKKYTEEKE